MALASQIIAKVVGSIPRRIGIEKYHFKGDTLHIRWLGIIASVIISIQYKPEVRAYPLTQVLVSTCVLQGAYEGMEEVKARIIIPLVYIQPPPGKDRYLRNLNFYGAYKKRPVELKLTTEFCHSYLLCTIPLCISIWPSFIQVEIKPSLARSICGVFEQCPFVCKNIKSQCYPPFNPPQLLPWKQNFVMNCPLPCQAAKELVMPFTTLPWQEGRTACNHSIEDK